MFMLNNSMLINGDPKYSDVSPLRRHWLYGVNCYQNAIGYDPVTVFTAAANPTDFAYMCLAPGTLAQRMDAANKKTIQKKDVLDACREDGLILLDTTSIHATITVPNDMRLIALYFREDATGANDFDFKVLNKHSNKWESKTIIGDKIEMDSLIEKDVIGYRFEHFLLAPENIQPLGLPHGTSTFFYQGDDVTLRFVEGTPHWARGPVLQDRGTHLYRDRYCPLYAKPAWPAL